MIHLILFEHESSVPGFVISERLLEKSPANYNIFARACTQLHDYSMELQNSNLHGNNISISESLFDLIGEGTCIITNNGLAVACSSASVANVHALLSSTLSANNTDSMFIYLYTRDSRNAAISQYKALKLPIDTGLMEATPEKPSKREDTPPMPETPNKYIDACTKALKSKGLLYPVTKVVTPIDLPKKNIPEDILDNILSSAKKSPKTTAQPLVGRSISNLYEKLMCNVRLDPSVRQLSYFESVVDLIDYMYPYTSQTISSEVVSEKIVNAIKACLRFDCSIQNNTDGNQTYTDLHSRDEKQLEQSSDASWHSRNVLDRKSAHIYLEDIPQGGFKLRIVGKNITSEAFLKETAAAEVVINEVLKILQSPDAVINFIAQGISEDTVTPVRDKIDFRDFFQYKVTVSPTGFVTEEPVQLKSNITKEQLHDLDEQFSDLSRFILRQDTAFLSKIHSTVTGFDGGYTAGLCTQIFSQICAMIYPVVTAVLDRLYYSVLGAIAQHHSIKKYTERIGLNHSVISGAPALFYIIKGEDAGYAVNSSIFAQSSRFALKLSVKSILEIARKSTSDMWKTIFQNPGVRTKLEIQDTTKKFLAVFDIPLKVYPLGKYVPGVMTSSDTRVIDAYKKESMSVLFSSGTYVVTNSLEDCFNTPELDRYGRMSARNRYKYYNLHDVKSAVNGPNMPCVVINSENTQLNTLVSAYNSYDSKIGIFAEGAAISVASNHMFDLGNTRFSFVQKDPSKGGISEAELFAVRFMRESSLHSLYYGTSYTRMHTEVMGLNPRNCGSNVALMPTIADDDQFRKIITTNKTASIALVRSTVRYRRSTFWANVAVDNIKSALSGTRNTQTDKELEARWSDLEFLDQSRNDDQDRVFPECEVFAYTTDKSKYISIASPLLFKQTTTTLALVTRAVGLLTDVSLFMKSSEEGPHKEKTVSQAPAYVQSEYTKIFKASKLEKFNKQRSETFKRLRKMREEYSSMFRREMSSLRKENRAISSIKQGKERILPEEEALNKLYAQGAIEGYRMHSGKLVIKTPEMNIYEGPMIYKIGKFAIAIDGLTGTHLNIKFYNLTNQKRFPRNGVYQGTSHDHPHIRNGLGCLGNLETLLSQALENRDVLSIVSLCKSYLNTVNVEDGWGRTIFSTWQKVFPTVHNIIAFGVAESMAPNKYILLHKTVAAPTYKMIKDITHAEIVAELGETLKCPVSNVAELTVNSSSPLWDKYKQYSLYADYIKENKEDAGVTSSKSELEIRRNIATFMQITSSEEFWDKHCRGKKSTKLSPKLQAVIDDINRI